ncbi:transmembrane protein [Cystoisospora suis]|uniref:Transmembrane protein n=1 Tax=Cystoisospora suis TaxID=483139 RepID=A0A2C6L6I5_9APIC|nr:transmembrane protein [Cystoisospora suis]
MFTVIVCSVLFYGLGLLAPTLAALHSCLKQKTMPNEKSMLLWTQYFLLFSTLATVVFPYVVTPICFLLPSWVVALLKAALVIALVTPKFGLVPKFFGWFLAHYVDYLAIVADAVQKHIVTPLKSYVTDGIDRMQATSGSHASRKEL